MTLNHNEHFEHYAHLIWVITVFQHEKFQGQYLLIPLICSYPNNNVIIVWIWLNNSSPCNLLRHLKQYSRV